MKRFLAIAVAALSLAAFAGCPAGKPKADPAAQEACKTSSKDADSCKACCNKAGASGYMFMNNACKCL